jgi:CBS domain-containing protein
MKIRQILSIKSGGVITADPTQTLQDAVALLAQHNIGALVIVDENGKLVGILSERDIVRRLNEQAPVLDLPIREVMTQDVITAVPEDDLMSVAHTMTKRRFRHLPIIDDQNNLIGIVSIGDLLKAQRDRYRGEIDTLETQIMAENE